MPLTSPEISSGTTAKEGGVEGDVITFKINGSVVGTGVWHGGTSVQLDFTTITHSITLVSGWNLVSFNIHPNNTAIANVLSSLGPITTWSTPGMPPPASWLKYDPNWRTAIP